MFDNKNHREAWLELMRLADDVCGPTPCSNFPEAFYPDKGGTTQPAKSLCNDCPIREECLEYGILYEGHGIFGGMAARDRQAIRVLRKLGPLASETIEQPVESAVDPLLDADFAHAGDFSDFFESETIAEAEF